MKGLTNNYYQLFLEAKSSFIESDVIRELKGDFSDYKVIYDEISKLLHDASGIGIDSLHTRKQLVIEERLNSKLSESINESLSIFQSIRDAVTDKVLEFSNKVAWIKAIQLSLLYYLHRKLKTQHGIPEEYHFIAESLFYLKKRGFNIESIDGYIKTDNTELMRLSNAIDYRVKKLGKQGLLNFVSVIGKNYSRDEQRFFFYRRRPIMPTVQKPSPPYGYVFNLFCKNLNSSCKVKAKEQERLLNEIQDLSTHLATVLDIDKTSPWANINVEPENIIEKLTEWVLYPEIFYIPQISPVHGNKIFPRIFELIDNNTEEGLSEIMKTSSVMERIEDSICQQGAISGEFTEKQIVNFCLDIDKPDNIKQILNSISKPAEEINKGYLSPFDAYKSNIREFPLIKTKTGYVVANIATYNMAKYRSLLKVSEKHNPKTEQRLGFALEDFIKERFDKSNIEYHHSVNYSAPEYVKKITNTNRDKGECDFIIESSEYVYLIEVKKKGLTKESHSGSGLHLLLDIALSFLRSINQLTIAEIILLNEGKISYSGGDKEVVLNGRDIFKLVISLEDMASLQCDNIKNSILKGLYNIRVDVNDDSANDVTGRINKTIEEFTLLQEVLISKGHKYQRVPFHHVSYLSTPQLLTILDDVDNNDDLSHNISCSNSVVYSLMDWYASYKASKNNKLFKDNKDVFKDKVLIN
jgi:hypothetical protein